jgi:2-phosphosulfolactate phosphatase
MLPYYDTAGKIVVVIDVFRATSAISTALEYGIKEIIPVRDIHEALEYKSKGYIAAAERKGAVVEGFDFGNSPYAFMDEGLRNQSVVLTTSNCTAAILEVKDNAAQVLMGAFTNFTALTQHLLDAKEDVILLCAGWKNRYSLEDSLFAGAVVDRLYDDFLVECDSAFAMKNLYRQALQQGLDKFLAHSSHRNRLAHLNIEKDIAYCLLQDQAHVVPIYNGHSIVPVKVKVEVS